MKGYQCLKNLDVAGNPNDIETGVHQFEYLGDAICTAGDFNGSGRRDKHRRTQERIQLTKGVPECLHSSSHSCKAI